MIIPFLLAWLVIGFFAGLWVYIMYKAPPSDFKRDAHRWRGKKSWTSFWES